MASGASNLADGGFALVLPLVALRLTRSPAAFAVVTVVGRLPWLLFALPAGALADRLDRRATMSAVNAYRALVIGVLALVVATGRTEMWMLYVVGFSLGICETLFDTAAQSMMPNIIKPDDLDRANGRLYAVELTANQFLGPPLFALIAGVAIASAVAASSALYLLASMALLTMTGTFRPTRTGSPTTIRKDVVDGVRYLARHELLRVLSVCVGLSNLASSAAVSILPLYVIEPGPIGLSEAGYGLLITSIAAGSVLGTTAVSRLRALLGTRRTLLLATLSFPLFSLAPVVTDSAPIIALGLFSAGTISISWNVITVSLRQRIVPDELLGRVNAGHRLVAWGTMPLGAALGGILATRFGIPSTLLMSAAISSMCAPVFYFGTNPSQLTETVGPSPKTRPQDS